MDKRLIIIVFILAGTIGFVWFGVLNTDNPLQVLDDEQQEVQGEITSFYVAPPNLVVETVNLSAARVFATPADRQEEDFLWGDATLVEEHGKRQTWTFSIPTPQLVRKIYVIGEDAQGLTTERTVFPTAGISEIYDALWSDSPEISETLQVGERFTTETFELQLEQILEDSRCPVRGECIQAGRLVVEIMASSDEVAEEQFVISSTEDELKIGKHYVKIVAVRPSARQEDIPPEQYEVTFSIMTNPLDSNEI